MEQFDLGDFPHVEQNNLPRPGADYEVHGKDATLHEYNVAMALDRLGYRYIFQYSYGGGHFLPGGIVIDFLVDMTAFWLPVEVFGEYWHSGIIKSERDRWKIDLITSIFSEPVVVHEQAAETEEGALAFLRSELPTV